MWMDQIALPAYQALGYHLGDEDVSVYRVFREGGHAKRPYLKKEWCIRIVENPLKTEAQEHNRFRFWGEIKEYEGRILRVVTLEDRTTIHNAFPDRGFKR
jgi:hypothetical protein